MPRSAGGRRGCRGRPGADGDAGGGRGPTVMPRPSAIMPTARGLATDATRPIEAGGLGALPVARAPLDELVDGVRPVAAAAVDAMQVAAVLEADGVTDRAAQVRYGYSDVFALAREV